MCLPALAYAKADSLSVSPSEPLSVAERNALQGFNDTIDRLAPDFVTVSLVVCDPGEIMYSVLGHACLHLQCPSFGMDYIFSYESHGNATVASLISAGSILKCNVLVAV